MEKHKKLVRVVCLVLAALMVMTIGVPLIFAYAETVSYTHLTLPTICSV